MRFLYVVLLSAFSCALLHGQNLSKKISVNVKDKSVSEILRVIETSHQVDFSYNPIILPQSETMSLQVNDQPLAIVLDKLFHKQPLSYREINGQIVIIKSATGNSTSQPKPKTEQKKTIKQIEVRTVVYDTIVELRYDTITSVNFDTVVVVDTILHFDTLRVVDHRTEEAKHYCRTYYSLPIYKKLTNNGDDFSMQMTNFGVAFGKHFSWGNIEAGIEYLWYADAFNVTHEPVVNQTEDISISTKLVPDTRSRLYYKIPEGTTDTTWLTNEEPIYVQQTDTIVTIKTDTIDAGSKSRIRRNAQYLLFPVQYSYAFHLKQVQISPYIGVCPQVKLFSEHITSGDTNTEETNFSSFAVYLQAGFWLEFPLSDYFFILGGANFSHPLHPLLTHSNRESSLSTTKLSFGISYKF